MTTNFHRFAIGASLASVLVLTACGAKSAQEPEPRPVRAVTVKTARYDEVRSSTGDIRSRYDATIGFRSAGKIIERLVDVGQQVKAGQVLAKLDDAQAAERMASAEASLAGVRATAEQARLDWTRQATLFAKGFTTKARLDQAVATRTATAANAHAAEASLALARNDLSYSVLKADTDGVVTEVNADVGQVVAAGQPIVRIARPDLREAVFHLPESALDRAANHPVVKVVLAADEQVTATGHVREVAPNADAKSRTYEIRVELDNPPTQMALGATIYGVLSVPSAPLIAVPTSALHHKGDHPAVWTVAAANQTVKLREITVLRYEADKVLVAKGLNDGDVVVTAGVHMLSEGQHVRIGKGDAS